MITRRRKMKIEQQRNEEEINYQSNILKEEDKNGGLDEAICSKKIEQQALHDFLTNLPNRRYLDRKLNEMLTKTDQSNKVALLFIDLNNFKQINDTFGHPSGDHVIKIIARRLEVCIRENDFICRYGGDEFIIILENIQNREQVNQIILQIKNTLKRPIKLEKESVEITGSIGLSLYPDQGQDKETLIKIADQKMYHEKRKENNTCTSAVL